MTRLALAEIEREIVGCRACPRLVEWRERVAADKVARFADETYWGRPVPGFGDPDATVLVVGLAPAAHGANRTGRMFTGDRSGDFLYGALHRAGFADRATSHARDDGLALTGAFIGAVNRCAPPRNKPTPTERDACLGFLAREIAALDRLRVVLALGAFAWDGALRALRTGGLEVPTPTPRFGHAEEVAIEGLTLVGCFHPSQQNTFTGVLTAEMMDTVLVRCCDLAGR